MANNKPPQVSFRDMGRELDCTFYPIDIPLDKKIGKLSRFYDIWKNKFTDDNIPAWKDFSFEDFAGWHSHMRIMDIGASLEDYKKNLIIGEEFSRYLGKKTLHEVIKSGAPLKKSTVTAYDKYLGLIYDQHYCIVEGTIADGSGLSQNFTWIDLPLSKNGKKVSHIITAIQYKKNRK